MANSGDFGDFSRLFEGSARFERDRQRSFDAQLRKTQAEAQDLGEALLGLFAALPAAMIAARRAEYDRVVARYDDQHPRAHELKASLAELEGMAETGDRGRARATRVLAALRRPGAAFHGFVTGRGGAPRPGLVLRLVDAQLPDGQQATTEADGYFRISLPGDRQGAGGVRPKSREAGVAGQGAGGPQSTAVVEIVDDSGAVLYEDPIPLPIGAGSVYREYSIDDRGAAGKGGPGASVRSKTRRRSKKTP